MLNKRMILTTKMKLNKRMISTTKMYLGKGDSLAGKGRNAGFGVDASLRI